MYYRGLPPVNDLKRFEDWCRRAVAYHDSLPSDELELLALAQHYGLATRLLDWTTNPMVALYFATESGSEHKGGVYCYYTKREIVGSKLAEVDPAGPVALYRPRAFDRRIVAQNGVFTCHPIPSVGFTIEYVELLYPGTKPRVNLYALTIEAACKPKLMKQLGEVGVTRKALFPDLEGLSAFINWGTKTRVEGEKLVAKTLAEF